MIRTLIASMTALAVALVPALVLASEACSTRAMIVFDGSASMAEPGVRGTLHSRIKMAREAVETAMPYIAPFRQVGLIIYGPHRGLANRGSCSGINLKFAPQSEAGPRIMGDITALEPQGLTALTDAVSQAADVLDYQNEPGLIVLVTDGNETCGGSPCQLAVELSSAARDLTVHVIGFQVRHSKFTNNDKGADGATAAECLPALNGGRYVHTDDVESLAKALEDTLGCDMISDSSDIRRSPQG